MKFAAISMIVGCAVCGVFILWNQLSISYPAFRDLGGFKVFEIQLLFWPSSFLMIAASGASQEVVWKFLFVSILSNAILYGGVGIIVWWGIRRRFWVLPVLMGAIILGWYGIINA